MEQKDKELLLKDLCARLPYFLKVNIKGNVETLSSWADDDGNYFNFLSDGPECNFGEGFTLDDIKPYLRPMSSMTEEELDKIENIMQIDSNPNMIFDFMRNGDIIFMKSNISVERFGLLIDLFNKQMLDWRGLIKKDIAIAVTEENNPYK